MRQLCVLLALFAALVLAGCAQGGTKNTDSTKSFSGDQKAVAAALSRAGDDESSGFVNRNAGGCPFLPSFIE